MSLLRFHPEKARRLPRAVAAGVLGVCVALAGSRGNASTLLEVDLLTDTDAVRIDGVEVGDVLLESAACDVNGDGIADLVMGADEGSGPNNSRTRCGEAYVIYGRRGSWTGPLSLDTDRDVWIIGQDAFDNMGDGVACGDVDGDGFDDMILGAPFGDGPGNGRNNAGQAHIVFGGPSLPAQIDLLVTPGTILHGPLANHILANRLAVGDVNDDGLRDVLVNGRNSPGFGGATDAGRVHVVFGRSSWPAELDLLTQSDVTIYGESPGDHLGGNVAVGDIDRDGIDDVLAVAILGDGPQDTRDAAGDIHVFRGRPTWPAVIDLSVDASDMMLFGADPSDVAGGDGGLGVVDLEADGLPEVVVGCARANGVSNSDPLTGEVRTFEPGPVLPPQVDLGAQTDTVIYGAAETDVYGVQVLFGDVNGDGHQDLCTSAVWGDGPDETRTDAGEIVVFYGGSPFPAVVDLALDDPDLLVYGALADDELVVVANPDVNGDGVNELAASAARNSSSGLPSITLVSPLDTDGDGITNLPDNCPLIFNPTQTDSDLDRVGDACQGDYDGDGQSDAEDCAPADDQAGTPAEVGELVLSGTQTTTLTWPAALFADEYDVSRGPISSLDGTDYGSCQNARDADLTDTSFVDDEVLPPGEGFFYLVRGRNLVCPAAGSYGSQSGGQERINDNPAGCP